MVNQTLEFSPIYSQSWTQNATKYSKSFNRYEISMGAIDHCLLRSVNGTYIFLIGRWFLLSHSRSGGMWEKRILECVTFVLFSEVSVQMKGSSVLLCKRLATMNMYMAYQKAYKDVMTTFLPENSNHTGQRRTRSYFKEVNYFLS